MTLPKIEHNLIDTNLTFSEKIDYLRARCYVSACLHYGFIDNDPELSLSINTLNKLNRKINGL